MSRNGRYWNRLAVETAAQRDNETELPALARAAQLQEARDAARARRATLAGELADQAHDQLVAEQASEDF